jgi:hypothetical protein
MRCSSASNQQGTVSDWNWKIWNGKCILQSWLSFLITLFPNRIALCLFFTTFLFSFICILTSCKFLLYFLRYIKSVAGQIQLLTKPSDSFYVSREYYFLVIFYFLLLSQIISVYFFWTCPIFSNMWTFFRTHLFFFFAPVNIFLVKENIFSNNEGLASHCAKLVFSNNEGALPRWCDEGKMDSVRRRRQETARSELDGMPELGNRRTQGICVDSFLYKWTLTSHEHF